jgi:cytochrome c
MLTRRLVAVVAATFLAHGVANAQERGTLAEAQAMAESAAALLEAEGTEISFEAFDNDDEWKDRDLYVFVIDSNGINRAHGADLTLVGQDLFDLTDVNGFLFVQAFLAIEDNGWLDYVWADPITGLEEPKSSYIIRVGDYVVGVGAYLPVIADSGDRGTPAEARAMAEAAAVYLQAEGADTAFTAFTDSPSWKGRDLYVFVNDEDGIVLAHGGDPTLVGQNLWDQTDVNGFYFVRAIAGIETTGWIDYVWANPLNGLEEPKSSYIVRIDDYFVGVGAYQPAPGG